MGRGSKRIRKPLRRRTSAVEKGTEDFFKDKRVKYPLALSALLEEMAGITENQALKEMLEGALKGKEAESRAAKALQQVLEELSNMGFKLKKPREGYDPLPMFSDPFSEHVTVTMDSIPPKYMKLIAKPLLTAVGEDELGLVRTLREGGKGRKFLKTWLTFVARTLDERLGGPGELSHASERYIKTAARYLHLFTFPGQNLEILLRRFVELPFTSLSPKDVEEAYKVVEKLGGGVEEGEVLLAMASYERDREAFWQFMNDTVGVFRKFSKSVRPLRAIQKAYFLWKGKQWTAQGGVGEGAEQYYSHEGYRKAFLERLSRFLEVANHTGSHLLLRSNAIEGQINPDLSRGFLSLINPKETSSQTFELLVKVANRLSKLKKTDPRSLLEPLLIASPEDLEALDKFLDKVEETGKGIDEDMSVSKIVEKAREWWWG